MDKQNIINEVTAIFRDTLDNESIELSETTTAADIEEWDSLSHIQLVVAIEKHFRIRFGSREIQTWNNVGEMIESISAKLATA